MPTTKTMLGIGACAIAVVALCRRALRTPTPRDGRPQLWRRRRLRSARGAGPRRAPGDCLRRPRRASGDLLILRQPRRAPGETAVSRGRSDAKAAGRPSTRVEGTRRFSKGRPSTRVEETRRCSKGRARPAQARRRRHGQGHHPPPQAARGQAEDAPEDLPPAPHGPDGRGAGAEARAPRRGNQRLEVALF